MVLSGAGVFFLVCAAAFVPRRLPTKAHENLTVVPFTSYPGFEVAPSFSPDGNEIAFSWYHNSESSTTTIAADLYVKQIGNEHAVRLTNHEATFLIPAWSPDGRNIAFAMIGKNANGIYLIPALGGPERRIAEISPNSYNSYQWLLLSWSSDSRRVAFAKADSPTVGTYATRGEHHRIHLVNVETAEEQVLPNPSPPCVASLEPAFSPDGKYLATDCLLSEDANRIYAQPTDGGQPHEVTQISGPGVLNGLAWTADSQSILYTSQDGNLWSVPAIGGRPERLPFAHDTQTPTVARVGRRLAYPQVNFHPEIWRIDLVSGTKPARPASRFISSSGGEVDARISPDGNRIVFDSGRSGTDEIWICDRDGSNPIQISSFGVSGTPRWSPDSQHIVFDSHATGQAELYVVTANSGAPRPLATGTSNASTPFWSADGRWIYFSTEQPQAVWKVPSDGGKAIRLTNEQGYYPQESADGKRVFYVVGGNRNELWSVPVNGGDELREEGMPALRPGLATAWTPAQNGIYFIDGSPSHFFINYFEFSTRQLYRVSELPGLGFVWGGIAVSPNGDTLLYAGVDHGDSDIMLVEGFR